MKLNFKIFLIILYSDFVLAVSSIDFAQARYKRSHLVTKTENSSGNVIPLVSVTIQLSLLDNTNAINNDVMPAVNISTASNHTTAFELLNLAAQENPCYHFEYKTNSSGRYITSICCLSENTTSNFYWFVYINNVRLSHGIDSLKLKHQDVLRFEYQSINSTGQEEKKTVSEMQETGLNATGDEDALSQISVSVGLKFTTYLSSNAIPVQEVVTANTTTAFTILQLAAKMHPCYNFQYKTFSFGRYIETICCIEQNTTTGLYWFIYINGKRSSVGVDLLVPKHGDTLTFKYEQWNSQQSSHSTKRPGSASTKGPRSISSRNFQHSSHSTKRPGSASTKRPTSISSTPIPTGKGKRINAIPVNVCILLIIGITWTLSMID